MFIIILYYNLRLLSVFPTCGELVTLTVIPYYVPLYYTDIPLKLTALPQLVLHAHLLCESISLLRGFWTEIFSFLDHLLYGTCKIFYPVLLLRFS